MIGWLERWQIPLYLAALGVGAVFGLAAPSTAPALELAINPVLMVLLYATFLGVPLTRLGRALRDGRFLTGLLVLNFIVVPVVVYALSRFVADDQALLLGVLLVLLTPCIDYVIVFSGLAGAAHDRLLAAAPLLMLAQMLLLPAYLGLFMGPGLFQVLDVAPFLEAFLLLIVAPLTLAAITQYVATRSAAARKVMEVMEALMVPLMMTTLAVVVASQIAAVRADLSSLLRVIPLYVAFLVVMVPLGVLAGRVFGQDAPATRAVVFSGATRNSLVVLPLALALPESLALAAVVVVTQTLVELVGMVTYVRLIPRLVPHPAVPAPH
ncbi:arsenic resistance protein [Citricoccus sp. SGAir0253]|uniref:arsenic resistance protein n=1 Tax=Citricoccus sp. SGAir0253 TaxID=2567881 RepID=UPI0010CD30B6|nr:bile acid:sodium symporter [Citricoccus sp. SGAir0253]QCU77963.1 arsenic resistance protein [Citricoccus sp. SGAir0253]